MKNVARIQNEKAILWSGILVINNRRILTLKEVDKPFYILPGGKLELGESDEDAAIREAAEELGVSVELSEVFTEIIENSKNTGLLIRFKLFRAVMPSPPNPDKLPIRTEKIAWINSSCEQEGLDVGNLLIKLLPMLVEKGLID